MDLIVNLADFVVKTNFTDLPPLAVERAIDYTIDTLGAGLAGSMAAGVPESYALVEHWGGIQESTIMSRGKKAPAPEAAFLNSLMAHALDFDDTYDEATLHATVTALPVALALSEVAPGPVSGKEFITALAVGVDVTSRLGLACTNTLTWIRTATCGAFGATAAAGKILGLNAEQLRQAFGIVLSMTAGSSQALVDGALTKRMQPAFMARAGVWAALLAQKGVAGATEVLEGKFGFFQLYEGGAYRRETVLDGLGSFFHIVNLSAKPYPCCRFTHSAIDCALALYKQGAREGEIDEVVASVPKQHSEMVGKPFEIRENPQVDAQFSIPYTVATALLKGDVFLDDFSEKAIRSAERLNLAQKVRVVANENVHPRTGPISLQLKLKDGRTMDSTMEVPMGSSKNPFSREQFITKFRRCAAYSNFPSERAEKIIMLTKKLTALPDLRELINWLSVPGLKS